tara:strand:- start:1016 stop:1255 length:240 start_codon:yes stop_codon:yes gene_type:complete
MKTILIILISLIIFALVLKKGVKLYLQYKTTKELKKMMNAFDSNKFFVDIDNQNLHKKYNKNVVRGKDGRFKSKNEINK